LQGSLRAPAPKARRAASILVARGAQSWSTAYRPEGQGRSSIRPCADRAFSARLGSATSRGASNTVAGHARSQPRTDLHVRALPSASGGARATRAEYVRDFASSTSRATRTTHRARATFGVCSSFANYDRGHLQRSCERLRLRRRRASVQLLDEQVYRRAPITQQQVRMECDRRLGGMHPRVGMCPHDKRHPRRNMHSAHRRRCSVQPHDKVHGRDSMLIGRLLERPVSAVPLKRPRPAPRGLGQRRCVHGTTRNEHALDIGGGWVP
jgi:hypothetical protein